MLALKNMIRLQLSLFINQIYVLFCAANFNRWRSAASSPSFTTGYGDWYWANSNYGHTLGIDDTIR
jgi:hypothetical protein